MVAQRTRVAVLHLAVLPSPRLQEIGQLLFNSLEFAFFLPCVFALYFVLRKHTHAQNAILLIASYIFYGWWDPRFLVLIAISTMVDYGAGLLMDGGTVRRRLALATSVLTNLGMLGVFKYYNFFAESLHQGLAGLGIQQDMATLNIILPVGISFYTFQTLSYTIDIYRRKIEPCRDPIAFAAFVSFFPQLVAGPIERASHLLPQFLRSREISTDQCWQGARQILWGLFKKVVVADNLAGTANLIFETHSGLPGGELLVGVVFFAFQIYCDFSGYSDIALGTSRIFGFDLCANFRYPYFSRDIAEFWRRWHISLSSWFRDYVYIPLGGSRGTLVATVRNVVITFVVSGFWHGANWAFLVWGGINGILFLPLLIGAKNHANVGEVAEGRWLPTWRETLQILHTFSLVCLAWVFFRAASLGDAWAYLEGIVTRPWFSDMAGHAPRFILILALLGCEWLGRNRPFPLSRQVVNRWVDGAVLSALVWATIVWAHTKELEFIYFQF